MVRSPTLSSTSTTMPGHHVELARARAEMAAGGDHGDGVGELARARVGRGVGGDLLQHALERAEAQIVEGAHLDRRRHARAAGGRCPGWRPWPRPPGPRSAAPASSGSRAPPPPARRPATTISCTMPGGRCRDDQPARIASCARSCSASRSRSAVACGELGQHARSAARSPGPPAGSRPPPAPPARRPGSPRPWRARPASSLYWRSTCTTLSCGIEAAVGQLAHRLALLLEQRQAVAQPPDLGGGRAQLAARGSAPPSQRLARGWPALASRACEQRLLGGHQIGPGRAERRLDQHRLARGLGLQPRHLDRAQLQAAQRARRARCARPRRRA